MNRLKSFFEEERKRVFEPGPFFTQRVMAQLDQRASAGNAIWEVVPSSARPVLAIALMLMLCFIFVEVFLPQIPQRGLIEAYLEAEQNPIESILFNTEEEAPSRQEIYVQMIGLGEAEQ
jgi:hypothetical protein